MYMDTYLRFVEEGIVPNLALRTGETIDTLSKTPGTNIPLLVAERVAKTYTENEVVNAELDKLENSMKQYAGNPQKQRGIQQEIYRKQKENQLRIRATENKKRVYGKYLKDFEGSRSSQIGEKYKVGRHALEYYRESGLAQNMDKSHKIKLIQAQIRRHHKGISLKDQETLAIDIYNHVSGKGEVYEKDVLSGKNIYDRNVFRYTGAEPVEYESYIGRASGTSEPRRRPPKSYTEIPPSTLAPKQDINQPTQIEKTPQQHEHQGQVGVPFGAGGLNYHNLGGLPGWRNTPSKSSDTRGLNLHRLGG